MRNSIVSPLGRAGGKIVSEWISSHHESGLFVVPCDFIPAPYYTSECIAIDTSQFTYIAVWF
jgi:hypothetical protein